MFIWIYNLPAGLGILLFGLTFVATNALGVFLVRPMIRPLVAELSDENELIGNSMSLYSVMFGLLLGMLAVITYQNLTDSQGVADSEATAVAALYRDVTAYPEPDRTALQDRLRDYTRYVIEEAWPMQRRGLFPAGGRVTEIQNVLFAFEPKTEGQKAVHAEALRQFNSFVVFRRARLAALTTGLPPVLWYTMVGGTVLCLMLMWLFDATTKAMLALSGVTAFALGSVIGLIALMDNPFLGELGVSSAPYELVYSQLMH